MSTTPPSPPPYGALIELARRGARLSIQRAAVAAGVSKATWIDNVRGYRRRGDLFELLEPKPETIASQAAAVGLDADRMVREGRRPDVAEIMREMQRHDAKQDAHHDRTGAPAAGGGTAGDADPVLRRYIQGVETELALALARHGEGFTGDQAFSEPHEIAVYNAHALTLEQKLISIAMMRQQIDESARHEGRRGSAG